MNNRNPNRENTYSNLAAWCERYHKDSGIKIHPSSVPVDLVLEDLMGYVATLLAHDKTTVTIMDQLSQRVAQIAHLFDGHFTEYKTHVVSSRDTFLSFDERFTALEERFKKIEDILLTMGAQAVKETKKVKK